MSSPSSTPQRRHSNDRCTLKPAGQPMCTARPELPLVPPPDNVGSVRAAVIALTNGLNDRLTLRSIAGPPVVDHQSLVVPATASRVLQPAVPAEKMTKLCSRRTIYRVVIRKCEMGLIHQRCKASSNHIFNGSRSITGR